MNNDKSTHPKRFPYGGRMVTAYPTYIIIDGIRISRTRLSFAFQLELAKAFRVYTSGKE
ncbi:hypothetical protein OUHCRE2_26530 [Enterobacter asburiae]|jgi:hypothetical protein|nr:hypothetical protein TUM17556_29350 [Enterobacter asburiae]